MEEETSVQQLLKTNKWGEKKRRKIKLNKNSFLMQVNTELLAKRYSLSISHRDAHFRKSVQTPATFKPVLTKLKYEVHT